MHGSDAWRRVLQHQQWQDAFLAGAPFATFLDQEAQRVEQTLRDLGFA